MSGNLINFNNYKQFMLPTLYQQQTHLTKYSRWRDDLERREYWPETVYRFWEVSFSLILCPLCAL
jgi:hypothetical protein